MGWVVGSVLLLCQYLYVLRLHVCLDVCGACLFVDFDVCFVVSCTGRDVLSFGDGVLVGILDDGVCFSCVWYSDEGVCLDKYVRFDEGGMFG